MARIRHDWSRDEVAALHGRPLLELVDDARAVHREHHPPTVQRAALLSVKTGGCPEDCGYCPQSAHHAAGVDREPLMDVGRVVAEARAAREQGASRFCMGGAYRDLPDGEPLERLLGMVREVRALGLETCLTMGMVRPDQARRLREAGLSAYNHNLDTGPRAYGSIVSTRTYEDRLATLRAVADAGIAMCCGGILGMGESEEDRIDLLHVLATLAPHPESVPVNALVAVAGTPMEGRPAVEPLQIVRTVAVARILMPAARIRLSAGRRDLSDGDQALCFLAGANSVFAGDRLLTTPNVEGSRDASLFARLGLAVEPAPRPGPLP